MDEWLQNSIVMLDMPPVHSSCQVTLRNARKRDYFAITNKMELNSKPYKYILRVENVPNTPAELRVELVIPKWNKQSLYQEECVSDGIVIERTTMVQPNIVEMRIAFQTYSYSFKNALFFLNVWINGSLVYTSEHFELLARRNRKRTVKKQI